jgi:hypothetical protein
MTSYLINQAMNRVKFSIDQISKYHKIKSKILIPKERPCHKEHERPKRLVKIISRGCAIKNLNY